jgi:adenosylmethionine-8-amino-7-oxononanoate aminotransferase
MGRLAVLLEDSPMQALGMIAAVEIKDSAGGAARVREIVRRAYELGLFIRPLGPTIYLWPPLNIDESDLRHMIDILLEAARAHYG